MAITMERTEYDALLNAAQAAVDAGVSDLNFLELRKKIDNANDIRRYFLLVRWVETRPSGPPPQLGQTWPPEQEATIELERPIARDDVDQVLETRANNPVTVLVTTDRFGKVGLTELDNYDFQINT